MLYQLSHVRAAGSSFVPSGRITNQQYSDLYDSDHGGLIHMVCSQGECPARIRPLDPQPNPVRLTSL
jgi:hypothetical protein